MSQISAYLQTLDAELRLPRRLRLRLLREVADHLDEARAALVAVGVEEVEAQQRVLADFGDARELARSFGAQAATTAGRRATVSAGAALLGFFVLFCALSALPARRVAWLDSFPSGAAVFILAQVALVGGVLTVVRVWRDPRGATIDADRLRYVLRGNVVALSCVLLAASICLAAAVGHLHPGRSPLDAIATLGLLLVLTLTGSACVRTLRSASVLGAAAAGAQHRELALDDLQAAARRLWAVVEIRAPRLSVWIAVGERRARGAGTVLGRRAAFLAPWLDLRRHPWRFCATAAALVGCLLAAQHGLADGGLEVPLSVAALGRMLLGGLILASLEALSVVAGFALLGGWLGIRPPIGEPRR